MTNGPKGYRSQRRWTTAALDYRNRFESMDTCIRVELRCRSLRQRGHAYYGKKFSLSPLV